MSIDAMKQALEALEECIGYKTSPFMERECEAAITALRAAIEQPRQWQGLTDEEVLGAGNAAGLKAKMTSNGIIIHPDGIKNFARAIEAKLKEKNYVETNT